VTAKRKRDREATRERLLEVARLRFARDGYDAASVRDIAGDADVDATLIFRYFGSKKRLFDEATATGEAPADLLDGPPEELVARMMREVVFHDWSSYGGEHPLLAMLKSAGHEDTRQRIRQEVCDTYVAALEELAEGPDAQLRAELLSAWLVGVGILRSVVGTPALTEAAATDLAPHVASVATGLLGRPMSGNT
jgi:AcrR family transcriptional regulator